MSRHGLVRWTMEYTGFHGTRTLRFMVPYLSSVGDDVFVTESVARRLNAAVCPSREQGCTCGELIARRMTLETWERERGYTTPVYRVRLAHIQNAHVKRAGGRP